MLDRVKFLESLADLAEHAQKNGRVLTKEEVNKTFQGMNLDESQYDLIYRYLFEKKITIQGICIENSSQNVNAENEWQPEDLGIKAESEWQSEDLGIRAESEWQAKDLGVKAESEWQSEDLGIEAESEWQSEDLGIEGSARFGRYLQELDALPKCSEGERLKMVMLLNSGKEDVLPDLLNASLYEVVEIAGTYCGKGVLLEDLIQEGNIGLIHALRELTGKKQESPLLYIRESIQYAMEQYINSQAAKEEEEERMVSRLALLHEAAKELSKENGVLPSVEQLSEFTKISEQEIRSMVSLSKDVNFYQ